MAAREMNAFLLVLGEREGIWWVLSQRQMAFEAHRAGQARMLQPGVELLLYATRGAFHNPTRDRGRIIAAANVRTPVVEFSEPVTIAGREFTLGCELELQSIASRGHGVDLAPLVEKLEVFPVKHAWSARLRQPLVPLPGADAELLRGYLRAVASLDELAESVESYRWPARTDRERTSGADHE
jgi:hypothetical protein